MPFSLTPKTRTEIFCCYSQWLDIAEPGEPTNMWCFYIGSCRLVDVFNCPDAYRNTMWQEKVALTDAAIIVQIDFYSTNKIDVWKYKEKAIEALNPEYNRKGVQTHGRNVIVTCVETGKTYRSAKTAAQAHGVAPQTISNHLSNRPGYGHVHGFHFIRGVGKTVTIDRPVSYTPGATVHSPSLDVMTDSEIVALRERE